MKRFLISFSIFVFLWIPMFFIGLSVVFLLLLTPWDGTTTWFGNYLHGRKGNAHMPVNPTLFDQWVFLALRNPISNFGKFTLSRGPDEPGVWLESIGKRVGVLYGWKYPDPRLPGSRRPFVFRPWVNWRT